MYETKPYSDTHYTVHTMDGRYYMIVPICLGFAGINKAIDMLQDKVKFSKETRIF